MKDHSHVWLWMMIFGIMFMDDCTASSRMRKDEIRRLQHRVEQLEHRVEKMEGRSR